MYALEEKLGQGRVVAESTILTDCVCVIMVEDIPGWNQIVLKCHLSFLSLHQPFPINHSTLPSDANTAPSEVKKSTVINSWDNTRRELVSEGGQEDDGVPRECKL